MQNKSVLCELCGEPMPDGETMFKYHGYSGNCPKPPLPKSVKPTYEQLQDKLSAAEARVKELEAECSRNEILMKIADELITNDNAKRDWDSAKKTRHQ